MKIRTIPVASTQKELEDLITKERKSGKRVALTLLAIAIFLFVQALGFKGSPIIELYQMQLTEGELTHYVVSGGKHRVSHLVVRLADGTSVSIQGSLKPHEQKRLIGEYITVSSQESCMFLNFLCSQHARQIQFQDELILDYENFVRHNMESLRSGRVGTLFFIFPFLFLLMAVGVLDGIRQNIRKIKRLYAGWEAIEAPFGIKLQATYAAGFGLFLLVIGIGLLVQNRSDISETLGIALTMLSALCFMVMYGTMNLAMWGYRLAKIVWPLLSVLGIYALVLRPTIAGWIFWTLSLNSGIAVLILIYLMKSKVKERIENLKNQDELIMESINTRSGDR